MRRRKEEAMRSLKMFYMQGLFLAWCAVNSGGTIAKAFAQEEVEALAVADPHVESTSPIDSTPIFLLEDKCDPASPARDAGRLCNNEVRTVLEHAAAALDMPMTIAVVDRVGNILGVFRKTNAPL